MLHHQLHRDNEPTGNLALGVSAFAPLTGKCVSLSPACEQGTSFSLHQYLMEKNASIDFYSLCQATLTFAIRSVFLSPVGFDEPPICYEFKVKIVYDNSLHDGRMLVYLTTRSRQKTCNGVDQPCYTQLYRICLNAFVLMICATSFVFSLRSLRHAFQMHQQTVCYFRRFFRRSLSSSEHTFFIDCWRVVTVLNDILTIAATSIQLLIEHRIQEHNLFAVSSILLGLGCLLAWISILRYLTFFQRYNVLMLTVTAAFPDLLRFMLSLSFIFGGFVLCGWLVFSPYHVKFRHMSTTAECLFSLVNGDDMFMSFAGLNPKGSTLIWYFNRVYVYTFVSVFTYVVISSLIGIVTHSFEKVLQCYLEGFPMTELEVSATE